MSDRYYLYDLECPFCGQKTAETIYADEWGEDFICDHCGKKSEIIMEFKVVPLKEKP